MVRLRRFRGWWIRQRWRIADGWRQRLLQLRRHADRFLVRLAQRSPALVPLVDFCRARGREWFCPSSLGERGERLARRYLQRLGYHVVDSRVRGPLGELDIVAVQDRTIVFVEVKTRRSHAKGNPLEAVGEMKQRRIARLALSWLKRHHLLQQPARFDVVGITWPHDDDRPRIRHVRNAFSPPGRWQLFS